MDTPHNTLTFCAQQAKCFRKNILRNNNKLSARIIHTYWAGCRAQYETNVRERKDTSFYRTWACQRESLCTHCILQHLVACSKPHTHMGCVVDPRWRRKTPGRISGAMGRSPSDMGCEPARQETCTVLGDVTTGYRTDHRPPNCIARSSEMLVYNYTTQTTKMQIF